MQSMTRFLLKTLIPAFLLFLLLGPSSAFADGSVRFEDDVLPLLHSRPDLQAALRDVEFPWFGVGRRISGRICPGLAGERTGPYVFRAVYRQTEEVEVRFSTYTRFYDNHGKLLGETDGDMLDFDLENATRLEEEVTAVAISPL